MFKDMNILYVEDEDFIRENLVESLQFMSIEVTAVTNGQEAYESYLEKKPDAIIADIEMPVMNGLQLAEKIRANDKETPIVITTAYKNTDYLLKAVELNLVKYLLKPIHIIELKNALSLCQQSMKTTDKKKYFNDMDFYDLKENKLVVNGDELKLDYHERQFLMLLLKYPNKVIPYEQIEVTIWEEGMSIAALRTLVKKLRQKLPNNSIENISKTGYKIVVKQ